MTTYECDGLMTISCKDTKDALNAIREAIKQGNKFRVNNQYETFYGVGFDRWLRDGVKDLDVTIKVTSYNQWEGYPWTYEITPNK